MTGTAESKRCDPRALLKIKLSAGRYICTFVAGGKGKILINGIPRSVDSKEPVSFNPVPAGDVKAKANTGEIRFYELKIRKQ